MLKDYISKLRTHKEYHFGYPYNLNFDYSEYGDCLSYLINNLGDPFIPSNYSMDSRQFEVEVIKYFIDLWGFDTNSWGYVTSSGTEGNLAGILYGKCYLEKPTLYYSEDTHYSVPKAALAYSLKQVKVPSDASGEIDYEQLKSLISPKEKAVFICNLSTTFRGAYDSAEKILNICKSLGMNRDDIYIHGDAALGGMILPFLDDADVSKQILGSKYFDSVSVSGHKMPGSPMPCGVIVVQKKYIDKFENEIEYLNSKDSTLNGSRNGLAALFLYESLCGSKSGDWVDTIHTCIANTKYLCHQLQKMSIEVSMNEYSNTIVFPRPSDAFVAKWQLACLGEYAHAVIMPNHSRTAIDLFTTALLADYQRTYEDERVTLIECVA